MSFIYIPAKEQKKLFVRYQNEVAYSILIPFLQFITENISILPSLEQDVIFGPESLREVLQLCTNENLDFKEKRHKCKSIIRKLRIEKNTYEKALQVFENLCHVLYKNEAFYNNVFPNITQNDLTNKINFFQTILHNHLGEINKEPWLWDDDFIKIMKDKKRRHDSVRKYLASTLWNQNDAPSKRQKLKSMNSSSIVDEKSDATFLSQKKNSL